MPNSREINARDFGSASSPEVDHVCAAVRWKEQIVEVKNSNTHFLFIVACWHLHDQFDLQVQYIESLDRARLATNFNASPPFLKCAALPSPASQTQPQSRLVTERVLELDELSVVGPKPVRISPVMEEESESDTASEVSELPTDEEEEEGKEKVKMFDPEEKDNLSEGELGNEESDNLVTVSKEDHSSDKEDVSESTNSEDSVREIRVKVDVEREDSCNEDLVEDVLVAEEEEQGEEDPSLIEAVSEVEEEEKCLESSSSSSYSSSTSSYASSTPSISPANLPHTSSPENLSDATVPKQQLEDVNLEEDVSEVLDTIKDIIPKGRPRTQDRRSVRKASLEDSGFESFQQSSVELEQEEKLEAEYREDEDEDEDDVIFMPGGAMELSQRMTAEELRADAVLERAERARAVARACREENQQLPERKVGFESSKVLSIFWAPCYVVHFLLCKLGRVTYY